MCVAVLLVLHYSCGRRGVRCTVRDSNILDPCVCFGKITDGGAVCVRVCVCLCFAHGEEVYKLYTHAYT